MRASRAQVRRVWLTLATVIAATLLLALPATALAWGEVFVSGSSWGGVDVYSNSPAPDPYYAQGDSGWGWRWQCVELPQRFYNQKGWVGATHWPGVDYAYQMYDVAPGMGLTRQANGSISALGWGDLVIWLGERTPYETGGHVAVVTAVSGSSVTIVEQNGLAAERGTRTIALTAGTLSDDRGEIRGIIKCPGGPPAAPSGQIAFVRGGDIWAINADGTNERRLTATAEPLYESDPSWSPDGRQIVYTRNGQLWLMTADGANQRRVPLTLTAETMPVDDDVPGIGRTVDIATWSTDGADITVAAMAWTWDVPGGGWWHQLFLVHPDGSNQRRLGPLFVSGAYGGVRALSWRPDGAQLLLSPTYRQGGGTAVIYDMRTNEFSVPFPSQSGGRWMWYSAWSPDGTAIATCVFDASSTFPGEPAHVAIIDMRTHEERALRIAQQSRSSWIQSTWSPDGRWLACSSHDGWAESPDTFLLSADGTESRLLMANAADPAWGPTAPAPTPSAKVTLKLAGLTSGAMKFGKSVTAKGKVTPASLAGSKVNLTVQKKRSARWVTLKSVKRTISATGAYSWKYKPAKKGAYRVRSAIAKTATHAAAKTKWLAFKVK